MKPDFHKHCTKWRTIPFEWGTADDWSFCADWANSVATPDTPIVIPGVLDDLSVERYRETMGGLDTILKEELTSIGYQANPLARNLPGAIALCQGKHRLYCAIIDPLGFGNALYTRFGNQLAKALPMAADIQELYQHPSLCS